MMPHEERKNAIPSQRLRRASGKAGSLASSRSPLLPFSPHPARCRSTRHPPCSVPDFSKTEHALHAVEDALPAASTAEKPNADSRMPHAKRNKHDPVYQQVQVSLAQLFLSCPTRPTPGPQQGLASYLGPIGSGQVWKKNTSKHQPDEVSYEAYLIDRLRLPAPVCPKTKLSGRNSCPKGPARTLSIVPSKVLKGSKLLGLNDSDSPNTCSSKKTNRLDASTKQRSEQITNATVSPLQTLHPTKLCNQRHI